MRAVVVHQRRDKPRACGGAPCSSRSRSSRRVDRAARRCGSGSASGSGSSSGSGASSGSGSAESWFGSKLGLGLALGIRRRRANPIAGSVRSRGSYTTVVDAACGPKDTFVRSCFAIEERSPQRASSRADDLRRPRAALDAADPRQGGEPSVRRQAEQCAGTSTSSRSTKIGERLLEPEVRRSEAVRSRYFFLTMPPSTLKSSASGPVSIAATCLARGRRAAPCVFSSTSTIVRRMRPGLLLGAQQRVDQRRRRSSSGSRPARPSIAANRDVLVEVGEVRRDARDDLVVGRALPLGEPLDEIDAALRHAHVARRLAREQLVDDLEHACRGRRSARAPCSGNDSCSAVFM